MGVLRKIGNAFLGNLGTAIIGGISSAYSQHQQNKNIDKQIQSQENEQKKNREYNLKLAQMHNQWNVEQWQRENDYNDPQAQIARLRAAGLNPDLIYGSGDISNVAAGSPQMTSGAPSAPVDYSSLANKRTVGDSVMQSLAIEQARANIRKTNAEADIGSADAEVRARMNSLGLSKLEIDTDLAQELSNLYNAQGTAVDLSNDEAQWRKEIREKFGNEYAENKIKAMAAETKIAESQMQYEVETLLQRIVGTNAENTPLVNISNLSNQNVRLLIDLLRFLLK